MFKKKKRVCLPPQVSPRVSLEPCRAWEALLWAPPPVLLVPGQCQRCWQWPFACLQALLPSCFALSRGAGTLSDMGGRVGRCGSVCLERDFRAKDPSWCTSNHIPQLRVLFEERKNIGYGLLSSHNPCRLVLGFIIWHKVGKSVCVGTQR